MISSLTLGKMLKNGLTHQNIRKIILLRKMDFLLEKQKSSGNVQR